MRNMKFAAQLLVFATLWAPGVCEDFSLVPSDVPSMAPTNLRVDDGSVGATVVSDTCNICGEGEVGNSLGIVSLSDGSAMTCGTLESTASKGDISQEDCPGIQALVSTTCSCGSLDPIAPVALVDPAFCQVCGVGNVVGSRGGLTTVPGIGTLSCMDLANMGKAGNIDASQCESVQAIASEECQCIPTPVTLSPAPVMSSAPVQLTASAPASAPILQDVTPFVCSICGDDMLVMLPNATVEISAQPNRTCSEYAQAAIPEDQCGLVQLMAATPCGCVPQEPQEEKPEPEPSDPVDESPSVIPSDMPSLTPTSEPSQSVAPSVPTSEPSQSVAPSVYVTPVVTFEGCFDDLTNIYALERDLEDPSILRKYILCSDTTFNIGIVDDDGGISEGQQTIQLRPNVIYQCGEDGNRSNGCIVEGGDFGLTSFYGVYNDIYETVENVMIKGLTFQSQQLFSVVLEAAGDISFLDCAFFNQGNSVPIILQWEGKGPEPPVDDGAITRNLRVSAKQNTLTAGQRFYARHSKPLQTVLPIQLPIGGRKLQAGDLHHIVTFQDCVFKDNYATKTLAFPGVIENTYGSELIVRNCLFEGNDFGGGDSNPAPFGYAIRSFGPLTLENTCFVDNSFQDNGPVLVFGAPYEASNNYISTDETNLKCELISLFETEDQVTNDTPTCIESDLDTCGFTQTPTAAPTSSPPTVADGLDASQAPSAMSGEDDGDNKVEGRGSGSSTRHCSSVVLISLGMATLMA